MLKVKVKDITHKAFEIYLDSLAQDKYYVGEQLEVFTVNKIVGILIDKYLDDDWDEIFKESTKHNK